MSKCIYCGTELMDVLVNGMIVGYQCVNANCPNPVKEWTVAEHIDNQNWNILKVRELETRVQELEIMVSNLTLALQNHLK